MGETPEDDLNLHTAADDYAVLAGILVDRPPLPHSVRVAIRTTATDATSVQQDDGFMPDSDYVDSGGMSSMVEDQLDSSLEVQGGLLHDFLFPKSDSAIAGVWDAPSYDSCRFRRNSHCYFPKELDQAHTQQAGYEVWFVIDRGTCPRLGWKSQEKCPVYEPGPNTNRPDALIECTKNWDEGGQRDGMPGPVR